MANKLIVNPTTGELDYINSASAGVTKIIAGTNVIISPTVGTGNVTINSSGGPLGTLGTTTNYYVNATTGDDNNNGLTLAAPFLTIQKALNTIAVRLFPGSVIINVAAGTYAEKLVPKEIMGATITSGGRNSNVTIAGDLVTPDNVKIIAPGGRTFDFQYVNTNYTLAGISIENNGTGIGLKVFGSKVFLVNVNFNNCLTSLWSNGQGGLIEWANSATGGNIVSAGGTALQATLGGTISMIKKPVITGVATAIGVSSTDGSLIGFTNGFDMTMAAGGNVVGMNAVNFSTINLAGPCHIIGFLEGAVISSRSSLRVTTAATTVNLDGCTAAMTIDQISLATDISTGGNGWTYTNGTPAVISLDPGAIASGVVTGNFFGGATISYVTTNTNSIKWGGDDRYAERPTGNQDGALPQGVSVFFGNGTTQANSRIIYTAEANESVDEFFMTSPATNGAAHTDTYTLYKNGAATTMTFSVTNAATGSTTTNPVSLVKGDYLGYFVATDAATAAADVSVQTKIRKL